MKSLSFKIYWPVILVVIGMFFLWGELSFFVASIVLVCVSAAWIFVIHTIYRAFRCESVKQEETEDDIHSSIQIYAKSVSLDFDELIEKLHGIMTQMASIHEDAFSVLPDSFFGIESQSREQVSQLKSIVRKLTNESEDGEQKELLTDEIMSIAKILATDIKLIKECGDELLLSMASMNKQVGATEMLLKEMDDISVQTSILALNAQIEATHAGSAGKGFSIVANEVKKLAQRSNLLSQHIAEHQSNIAANINQANEIAHNMQSNHMEESSYAKQRIPELVDELNAFNGQLMEQVGKLSDGTIVINQHVDEAVRALQFDDLTRQLHNDFKKGFECIELVVSTMLKECNDMKDVYGCTYQCLNEKKKGLKDILTATGKLKILDIASHVRQENMNVGKIEFF